MKKSILLLLALIVLSSYVAAKGQNDKKPNNPRIKEYEIVMDRDGRVKIICWKGKPIYQRQSGDTKIYIDPFNVRVLESDLPKVLRAGLGVGTMVKITITDIWENDKFNAVVIPQQTKYELIPIFTGKTEMPSTQTFAPTAGNMEPQSCSFFLDKPGTTYQIEITRITDDKDPSKEAKEKVIFAESLHTEARYHFGSHIGVFVPLRKSAQYSLAYYNKLSRVLNPQEDAVITENNSLKVTMVFIASYYPFGYEPDGRLFSPKRIQLNLGAELSSSIFKRIYFGPGIALKFCSINFLFRYGETQKLQDGFSAGEIIKNGIGEGKPVPTVSKNKFDWGVTLCLPADFLIGWLGKSLGLK